MFIYGTSLCAKETTFSPCSYSVNARKYQLHAVNSQYITDTENKKFRLECPVISPISGIE